MSDYQTVIGLVLAAFVLVGIPYLLACLPPKRDPETVLPRLAVACGAGAVHVSSLQDPESDARDARMAAALSRQGVQMLRADGYLLTDADQVRSKSDAPYRVFTPFFKAASPTWRHRPRAAPERLASAGLPAEVAHFASVISPPRPRWDAGAAGSCSRWRPARRISPSPPCTTAWRIARSALRPRSSPASGCSPVARSGSPRTSPIPIAGA